VPDSAGTGETSNAPAVSAAELARLRRENEQLLEPMFDITPALRAEVTPEEEPFVDSMTVNPFLQQYTAAAEQ
jgi:hypothetical protein